jgi:hypothetical protein
MVCEVYICRSCLCEYTLPILYDNGNYLRDFCIKCIVKHRYHLRDLVNQSENLELKQHDRTLNTQSV